MTGRDGQRPTYYQVLLGTELPGPYKDRAKNIMA